MAKLTKFTIAPDGRLVYQSNGTIVRGKVTNGVNRDDITPRGYTVINNRVYHNGRLAGYVSAFNKLPKGKRALIEKRAKARAKRAEKRAIKEAINDQSFRYDSSWKAYADAKKMMDNYHKGPGNYQIDKMPIEIRREEQNNLNFASILECAIWRGVCSEDGASRAWFDYINGGDDVKSMMWREMDFQFTEHGFNIDSCDAEIDLQKYLTGIDDDLVDDYLNDANWETLF